jgi:hypothetical protein
MIDAINHEKIFDIDRSELINKEFIKIPNPEYQEESLN